jgi:predicted nucleic acid-binding protein
MCVRASGVAQIELEAQSSGMQTVKVVIDASVFVAAATLSEPHHAVANTLLTRIIPISNFLVHVYLPTFFMLEIFAAVQKDRPTRDLNLVPWTPDMPLKFHVAQLTDAECGRVIEWHHKNGVARPHTKRGGDLVYLALAWKENCTLVTLDKGLLAYDGAVTPVVMPDVFLAKHLPKDGTFLP